MVFSQSRGAKTEREVSRLNSVPRALLEYLASTGDAGHRPWYDGPRRVIMTKGQHVVVAGLLGFQVKSLITLLNPPAHQPHQVGLCEL